MLKKLWDVIQFFVALAGIIAMMIGALAWFANQPLWLASIIVIIVFFILLGIFSLLLIVIEKLYPIWKPVINYILPRIKMFFRGQENKKLAKRCENLADNMDNFIYDRKNNAPSWNDPKYDITGMGLERHRDIGQYKERTQLEFEKKFASSIQELMYDMREIGHNPIHFLTHGSHIDDWSSKKSGILRSCAKRLRKNELINEYDRMS